MVAASAPPASLRTIRAQRSPSFKQFAAAVTLIAFVSSAAVAQRASGDRAHGLEAVAALHFEPNVGQAGSSRAAFLARAGESVVWLAPSYIEFPGRTPRSRAVRLEFPNANPAVAIEGVDHLRMKVNYFRGTRENWRTGVPTFSAVRYRNLYPGIDLLVHPSADRVTLEYDFEVAPNADPSKIRIRYRGAKAVQLDAATGEIKLQTSIGELRQLRPVVYQQIGNGRHEIAAHYEMVSSRVTAIHLNAYRKDLSLTIDPAIVYSTVLPTGFGSASSQFGRANAVQSFTDPTDRHVYAYVAGSACAPDFPVNAAIQSSYAGSCDAFVSKIDPTASGVASVVWSTFLGGSNADGANAAAVDTSGNVYIAGETCSSDFPTSNAFQNATRANLAFVNPGSPCPNLGSGFLSKISSNGSTLQYSTYFGGPSGDTSTAIALDASGRAYLGGTTAAKDIVANAPDIGCTSCYSTAFSPTPFSFLAILDTAQAGQSSLLYAEYLDGVQLASLAVDSIGGVHLAGRASMGFPGVNGFQAAPRGNTGLSAFYARLNPGAVGVGQVMYATYLGVGTPAPVNGFNPGDTGDAATSLTLDSSGNAYIGGSTTNPNLPTTSGVFQPSYGANSGQTTGYIARINPELTGAASLLALTYLGSGQNLLEQGSQTCGNCTEISGLAFAPSGSVVVAGTTNSPGFPVLNAVVPAPSGFAESRDQGATFSSLGSQSFANVAAIAIDSTTTPRTIYLGLADPHPTPTPSFAAVLKSADGGINWVSAANGLPSDSSVLSLLIDPANPQTLYAGTGAGGIENFLWHGTLGTGGVYRSTDGGATWAPFGTGIPTEGIPCNPQGTCVTNIYALAIDSGTLYAASDPGLFSLAAGQTNWNLILPNAFDVQVDTSTSPHTLYAIQGSSGQLVSSHDGGATWTALPMPQDINEGIQANPDGVALDHSTVPATIYLDNIIQAGGAFGIFGDLHRSTDQGQTWQELDIDPTGENIGCGQGNVGVLAYPAFAFDPSTTPTSIYFVQCGKIWKGPNSGQMWTLLLSSPDYGVVALDANGPSPVLYTAPTIPLNSEFVAELDPTLSTLQFSTLVGGPGGDSIAAALAVDGSGGIYLGGVTLSPYPPLLNAANTSLPTAGVFPLGDALFTALGAAAVPLSPAGCGANCAVTSSAGVSTGTITVTFPAVTGSTTSSPPVLSVTPLPSANTANFQLSNNLGAFDISTTAVYSGSVTLCFQALTVNDPTTFSTLSVLHIVGGVPVDITSSRNFATRTVCGTAASFSPFILVKGAAGQIQDLITAVNNFDLRKGIQTSLDAKLQNAVSAYNAANARNYANVCGMMSAFISEVQAQVGQTLTGSDAAPLISAAEQVLATVGCSQ